MRSTFNRIWRITSTTLVVLFVLCAVFLMGSRLLGYQCFTIISPSMTPTYGVGDLIYVKAVDPSTIQEGDPITFLANEDLVICTHRVVRVDRANKQFFTKGDANNVEDAEPVHYNNVLGVAKFAIPKLGYVSNFIQNPPGTYITLAFGIVLIAAVFLPDLFKKPEDEEATDSPALQAEDAEVEAENQRLKAEIEQLKAEMTKKIQK